MGGSGLESTNDFQKIYGSGLDRIPSFLIRTGLGLKFHSQLISGWWYALCCLGLGGMCL